jgi:hypothetical protein
MLIAERQKVKSTLITPTNTDLLTLCNDYLADFWGEKLGSEGLASIFDEKQNESN